MNKIRITAFIGIFLALVVVSLGAYTRLTHAGLGCPDWPGCYGFIDVPNTTEKIAAAEQAFPERPVEQQKAWNEMIHRYFAGALGLLVLALFALAIKYRDQENTPLKLSGFLLLLIIFQAALGMWTVTMKLMPIVVMAHLLGGFTTLCLLYLIYLRTTRFRIASGDYNLRSKIPLAFVAIVVLTAQIALGGWTSSNYAALACTELPICQAGWPDQVVLGESFNPIPPERDTYEFGFLTHAERMMVHVTHRFGAIITTIIIALLALSIFKNAQSGFMKNLSIVILLVLTAQVALGVSNIVYNLPLSVAVAHNVVAACLMLTLITLTYCLKRKV